MNANRLYYIRIRGRVIGPKELPDMQRLAQRAQLNSRTPVSEDGLSWLTAADFPEIFTKASAAAPPEQQPEGNATADVAIVAEEWFFAINGQQHPNPVSLATLKSYVQAGTLGSADLVFRSGWDNWRPVSSVPELSISVQTGSGVEARPNGGKGGIPTSGVTGQKPSSYLVPAILSLLCCCLPFGIVSVVFASQVDSKWNAGDHAGAVASASKAKLWFWLAFGFGFVINFSVFIIQVLVAIANG
jgi:hypothetical protein